MRRLEDLFGIWDSTVEMAADVDVGHWTVAKWRQRRSIPSSAWPAVIKALKRKGKDVGAADLLAMHTNTKRSPINKPNNRGDAA